MKGGRRIRRKQFLEDIVSASKIAAIFTIAFMIFAMLPHTIVTATAVPLADEINFMMKDYVWATDPASISIATIFGKDTTSAFDTATISSPDQWAWDQVIASEDGYSSATINSNVQSMMSSFPMVGALPETDPRDGGGIWEVGDRFMLPLYTEYSTWSTSAAVAQIEADLKWNYGWPLLGFRLNGGWVYSERYYDEWIEDLDICLKLGDTADAAALWAGVNQAPPNGCWTGTDYCYRPDEPDALECEVGFFAAIVANYEVTVGGIPNFDRVSTDLYNKLLVNGWSSPLWGAPSQMQHATFNHELREENTLGGIEALQLYYCVSDSAYRTAFDNLLTGGSEPAWQYLMSASNWTTSPDDGAETAALLFLYGIIPDTGSLAIPTNEWHYEDWTSMMPSTLFGFDYSSHTIKIPVNAGNIKFDFGSSIASYDFPSNGVYQVQFSSDWNSVTSASIVEGLTGFNFLSGGNSALVHDIAITNVMSSKTVVGQGCNLTVNVAIINKGNFTETFNVTAYANDTVVDTQQVSTLNATDQTSLTFTWNTTDLAYGNYPISAYAWPVPGQTDTSDNNFTGGVVTVTILGDIKGDFTVGLPDLVLLAQAYGSKPSDSNWNPNADINGNGVVDLADLVILAQHYGE